MVTVTVVLVLSACLNPVGNGDRHGKSTAVAQFRVHVEISGAAERHPALEPTYYRVQGRGPDGERFGFPTTSGVRRITGLVPGDWSIEASGINGDGFLVAHRRLEVRFEPGERKELSIELESLEGLGTLVLAAEWDGSLTVNPHVRAILTDSYGHSNTIEIPLTGVESAQTALANVPAGRYRVSVALVEAGATLAQSDRELQVEDQRRASVSLSLADPSDAGTPIRIEAEQFVLAWDAPGGDLLDGYRVYVRNRGRREWTLLRSVTASSRPALTVDESLLSPGVYELAVSSVRAGVESAKHSSMDHTAVPSTGWYLVWAGA
jgi:hypothetical protein